MRIRENVSRVIRVTWWISLVWLVVGFLGEAWWFVKYLSDPDNPYRWKRASEPQSSYSTRGPRQLVC